jgi:hypothetical protein
VRQPAELLGWCWKNVDERAVEETPAGRNRAAIVQRAETAQAADAKCSLAWHLCTSKQIVMCGSERFHRRFSSIDYGARRGLCACEFRGIFSGTLTVIYVVIGALSHSCARLNDWVGLSYAEKTRDAG